jgi:histidinol-phosphate/aromatic aminotransferase/cobyric acid decarboxylase-like protein
LPAAELYSKLVAAGIMVRQYPADPLLDRCLRVSTGTEGQNGLFLRELESILAGTHIH